MSGPTRGMVAGQAIQTSAQTEEYDAGYSRIFGNERKPQRGQWVWDDKAGQLVDASEYTADYDASRMPVFTDRYMEGVVATDGTDIGSRQKRRAYMRANNLADTDDYKSTWPKTTERRERRFRGELDRAERKEQVARALYQMHERRK